MEKKIAGLLGAFASLIAMSAAQASAAQATTAEAADASHPGQTPTEVMQVASYADLLKPIPNAAELLKMSNAELLQRAQTQPRVLEAQYYSEGPPPSHHHHHHHHHHHNQAYYPPPPPPDYHHHHHHHHNGVTIVVPGIGIVGN